MRSVLHSAVAVSLLWAFALAPLRHSHEDHALEEHAHALHHQHTGHHSPDSPEWEDDDHHSDARFHDWIAGDGTDSSAFNAVQTELLATPVPLVQTGQVAERRTQNHDPPLRRHLPPRAPPV